ncbi:Rpn family recombination-promoting nuclease/putative transposase [Adlercreutzia sp. ZJ154]|uniref:Rpn family recombination-promoting nuclease/putative transposase n=1 Tax=Adlercreutzia sp. ZJ154 TaxID=2709790 RepID=UPI0013EAE661|nr:Rpn family recombination-promoting nuclease/putative transposase [Adlercreutzia sp. ZJ154]
MDKEKFVSITNQFMFNRVMIQKDICKDFLECVLGKQIDDLIYKNAEQAIEPRLDFKSVRLDLFAKTKHEVFDIELQIQQRADIARRYRYYQASIDTTSLDKGADYDKLPTSYIIFVCNHDPFKAGLPIYEIEPICRQDTSLDIDSGIHWIALNCKDYAKTKDKHLLSFMEYVSTGKIDKQDKLVTSIACAVDRANKDREWVNKVFSVSTIGEDWEREVRIARRAALKEGEERGLERGLERGILQGRVEGLQQGRAEAEMRYAELTKLLLSKKRENDLFKASEDPAYREQLFTEFNI